MLLDKDVNDYAALKITTKWTEIEILSEPKVLLTFRGYAPVLLVMVDGKKIPRSLFIQAKSIATQLEEMRVDNNGKFTGLKFRLRKTGLEKTAGFEFD